MLKLTSLFQTEGTVQTLVLLLYQGAKERIHGIIHHRRLLVKCASCLQHFRLLNYTLLRVLMHFYQCEILLVYSVLETCIHGTKAG